MSAAVGELERLGLVVSAGVNRGNVGRSSITYSVGPGAGLVIGVDCGTTRVQAIACGLDAINLVDLAASLHSVTIGARRRRFKGFGHPDMRRQAQTIT